MKSFVLVFTCLSLILFSVIGLAADELTAERASFEGVHHFTANPIEGDLLIRCSDRGRNESKWQYCRGNMLNPTGGFAYFTVNTGEEFEPDRLRLTATWENGKQVTKHYNWDARAGRSENPVNLWIDTLFQNPLLNYGRNVVNYTLTDSDRGNVSMNQFTVTVEAGETLFCPDDSIYSGNLNDCRGSSASVCHRYFRRHNYCE